MYTALSRVLKMSYPLYSHTAYAAHFLLGLVADRCF